MPEVIPFKRTDYDLNTYLHVDAEPFTIAKVVRIKDHDKFLDFKAKQVNYVILQVPGFKIFLVQAGFINKPEKMIPEEIVKEQMQLMVDWWAENKTSNKRECNYYKLNEPI